MKLTPELINGLVSKFSERTLPKEAWTHEAHIIIALWHNWHFEFEEALDLVRNKIITYNEAVGTPNTDNSGYHETLTRFWLRLTKNYILENSYPKLEEYCDHFLKSKWASRKIPLHYYSRDVLFSVEARHNWVQGNLKEMNKNEF
jgi:hypothetical protein